MAKSLASLVKVKADKPPLFVAYGVHGIGKTSFAAEWPNPVFIQVEKGTPGGVELDSFGDIESLDDVTDAIASLLTESNGYQTIVIDSIDALEPLIWKGVCADKGWPDIEHGSDGKGNFGKGYVAVDEPVRDLLAACKAATEAGYAVVLLAHCDITRFDSPTTDPYSRYGIKLQKRAAALVQEAADVVAFFNYRTVLKSAEVGPKRVVKHGEGSGGRVMFFDERPGFLAKNRYKMPTDGVEYYPGKGYSAIAGFFPQPTGQASPQ